MSSSARWTSSLRMTFGPTYTVPSALTEICSCFSVSGVFSGFVVIGRLTGTPFWSMGVTTMKMMSSTRQTSTSGVTLMSDVRPALLTLPSELTDSFFMGIGFLQEVDGHLGARVGHLD